MKPIAFTRIALALAPLCLIALPPRALALPAPPAAPQVVLPPGTPPLSPAQQQKQQALLMSTMKTANAIKADPKMTPAQKRRSSRPLR